MPDKFLMIPQVRLLILLHFLYLGIATGKITFLDSDTKESSFGASVYPTFSPEDLHFEKWFAENKERYTWEPTEGE